MTLSNIAVDTGLYCRGGQFMLRSKDLGLTGNYYAATVDRSASHALSNDPDICISLVDLLLSVGRKSDAHVYLVTQVMRSTSSWKIRNKQGELARSAGNLALAIRCYKAVLEAEPSYVQSHPWPEVHWWLGQAYFQLGKLEEALSVMLGFVANSSRYPDAYGFIGTLLELLGRREEAKTQFEYVMQMTGDSHPQAVEKLARISLSSSDWPQAKKYLDVASKIGNLPQDLKFPRAVAHLITEDYESGWRLWDDVLPLHGDPQNPGAPHYLRTILGKENEWHGERVDGKRLLIWCEHGLGDALMMFRYIVRISERFGNCSLTVWTNQPLTRLFSEAGVAKVETTGSRGVQERANFDFHASIMSLPYIFQTFRAEDIPATVPYISVPSTESQRWSSRIQSLPGLKVGLVWAGNVENPVDQHRSIPLSCFAPLLAVDGVSFVSLQTGSGASQLQLKDWPIADFMEQCCDMLDTAALITNLDLVVSVDTSVVHLAGALGCPVWLLNRHGSEWRWLLHRIDSRWYPSMRIFQQKAVGEWEAVLIEIAQDMLVLASARSGPALTLT